MLLILSTGLPEKFPIIKMSRSDAILLKLSRGSLSNLKCLEKVVVYGFSGTDSEINERKKEMVDSLGMPVMEYSPKIYTGNASVSPLDLQIINVLRNDPMKKSPDISRILEG